MLHFLYYKFKAAKEEIGNSLNGILETYGQLNSVDTFLKLFLGRGKF